jgi:RecG-like helicase
VVGWLQRLRTSARDDERAELQRRVIIEGAAPLTACRQRSRVRISGTVRSTRVDMRGGSPVFEVEVFDGHGTVHALFLGRRRVRGLDVGRSLVVEGMLTDVDGEPALFNPEYELIA